MMGPDFSPQRRSEPIPDDARFPEHSLFEGLYREIHRDRLREGPRVVREGFRPIVNLSARGTDALVVETLRRGAVGDTSLSASDKRICSWEVASANFAPNTEGFLLTEKMLAAFFARDWQRFSPQERVDLARLVAEETLPGDNFGQTMFMEYVTMQLTPREEAVLMMVLGARGIRISEVVESGM
jgi:DNA-binding NarL/FixJ family response regulator